MFKYLLATNNIGKYLQEDIDLLVLDAKLNNENVRQKLDLLFQNI